MIIQKSYYSLKELADKWRVSQGDVNHLVENGELPSAIRVYDIALLDVAEEAAEEGCLTDDTVFNGLLGIRPSDAWAVFRDGDAVLNIFLDPESAKTLYTAEAIFVLSGDLVVANNEIDRYEARQSSAVVQLKERRFSFVSFQWEGTRFRFTPTQVAFLEKLYDAAAGEEPWQSGKQVLFAIRSSLTKPGDLFKRNKLWRDIVESDGRGMYRLSPSFLAYPPVG